RPKPMRAVFTTSGVLVTGGFAPPVSLVPVVPVPLDTTAFGRRRLGRLLLEPETAPVGAALGREVINAPRTSSSCCAPASAGTSAGNTAIKQAKNIALIFM